MRKSKLLKNKATYTSSTESIKVVAQNILNIRIGYQCYTNTTTALALATLIGHSSAIKLTVGGEIETLIRHDDLFALNYILHDLMPDIVPQKPFYLLATNTDNYGSFLKTILPVKLTTDKDVYVNLDYVALAASDTNTLALEVDYGDKPFSAKPIALRYISANMTASFVEYDLSVAGKKLTGLLLFSTTVPLTTEYYASIEEIKLLIKREEKIHAHWLALDAPEVDVEDTVLTAVLENYRYMDFKDDPIPADDLKAAIKSGGATDAVRLIGVYQ